jgi:conjugative transfer region protein (TIGR03750 family)
MSASIDSRRDTVMFLPHRLNRQPVIVRGLTADELWIIVALSGAWGLLLGIAFAALTRSIAMAPTVVVACIAAGIFVGGAVLRRHKRGRPETWLYRQLQWWACRRVPPLATHLGAGELITRSGGWTTRRTRRR